MRFYLFILLILITSVSFAKTRSEQKSKLRSGMSNFVNSTISSKKDNDDDDDDDNNSNSQKSSSSSSSSSSDDNEPMEFDFIWFWNVNSLARPKKFNFIERENKWFYLAASYNYKHWTPTGINDATTNTSSINIAKTEISGIMGLLYFSYETSFDGKNLDNNKIIRLTNKNKSAWERILAEVSLPWIIRVNGIPFARMYFSYDKQVFVSTVTVNEDKYYVPREEKDKPGDEELKDGYYLIKSGTKIMRTTYFKDYSFGINMDRFDFLNGRFGLFLMYYNKPYSLTIDDTQYDEQIHDTDFSAFGVFMGLDVFFETFYIKGLFKIGPGNIVFTGINTNLEELIEDPDYSVVYAQFDAELGFKFKLYENIYMDGSFKAENRKFSLSKSEDDKEENNNSESFDLNSDTIITAFLRLSYSF